METHQRNRLICDRGGLQASGGSTAWATSELVLQAADQAAVKAGQMAQIRAAIEAHRAMFDEQQRREAERAATTRDRAASTTS